MALNAAAERRTETENLGVQPRQMENARKRKNSVKYVLTGDDFPNVHEIALVDVLHPHYISLKIFGMLWQGRQKMFEGKSCSFDLRTLHCCLLLSSAWFLALESFASYDGTEAFGWNLFKKLTRHLFQLKTACGITAMVYYLQKHAPNFIKLWENYKIKHGGVSLPILKRNCTIIVIGLNVLTAVYVGGAKFYVLSIVKGMRLLPISNYFVDSEPTWIVILYFVVDFYVFMAWAQSLINVFGMTRNLTEEHRELSSNLKAKLNDVKHNWRFQKSAVSGADDVLQNRNIHKYEIEQYRLRHWELCKLVSQYDNCISSYLLFFYLFSIPILVMTAFALWGLDRSPETMGKLVFSTSSLIFFVVTLVSITATATALNTAVSECSVSF